MDLPERFLASRQDDGVPLPSVRALARFFGVAPLTAHRALRTLQGRGEVHSIPRKGFFWGVQGAKIDGLPGRPEPLAQARTRLVSDLRCGVFHPHRDLPSRVALSQLYGIGPVRMGRLLADLADEGVLVRRGRGFTLPPPPRRVDQGTVLVATRCDASGTLLLDTERQTDFVKSVHREGRELGLRIVVLGWYQEGPEGVFLDQGGAVVDPARVPGLLLGCLASTWLVRDPGDLLRRLRERRVPVSVWWEHPPREFPRFPASTAPVVGFDISFGSSSGIAVGRHLRSRGIGPVAFVSPFHRGEWSRARLEGLREGLRDGGIGLDAFVDDTRANAWEFHQSEGSVAKGERRIRALLRGFVDRLDPVSHPVWVAVNDHTAVLLLELLSKAGKPRPHLVSFDNTSASDAHQFDSFEFHTEGMVRQMLYHVLHPKARLFRDGGLHEMVGRLVLRT
jgi:DNA-binding LacI/PurR family transcriptional regulator